MKPLIILYSFLLFTFTAFGQPDTSLKDDPDLLKYQKIHHKIESRILSHYYQMPKSLEYRNEMMKAKSPEEMKTVLNKYGMQNSDEYVQDIIEQNKAMLAFMKKHPELMQSGPSDFRTKMMELLKTD